MYGEWISEQQVTKIQNGVDDRAQKKFNFVFAKPLTFADITNTQNVVFNVSV